MICPQCKAEYRPGFTHASDCDVALKRSGSGERHGKKPPVIRSNGFQRAWRGQERLWKIYWVYLILGSVIVMIGSTIVVPFTLPSGWTDGHRSCRSALALLGMGYHLYVPVRLQLQLARLGKYCCRANGPYVGRYF